jgi:hypothetical protein
MFINRFQLIVTLAIFCAVSNAYALSEHEEEVTKFYSGPVSAAQAFMDLEREVAAKLLEVCGDANVEVIKGLTFDIPFDVLGGTIFRKNGTPGNIQNPLFVYYSYPKVSARVSFVCE